MTTQQVLEQIKDMGFSLSIIARRVGKDPSTLQKYARGELKISDDLENEIVKEIRRLKGMWEEIDL